jgi:hypothetical protein
MVFNGLYLDNKKAQNLLKISGYHHTPTMYKEVHARARTFAYYYMVLNGDLEICNKANAFFMYFKRLLLYLHDYKIIVVTLEY